MDAWLGRKLNMTHVCRRLEGRRRGLRRLSNYRALYPEVNETFVKSRDDDTILIDKKKLVDQCASRGHN